MLVCSGIEKCTGPSEISVVPLVLPCILNMPFKSFTGLVEEAQLWSFWDSNRNLMLWDCASPSLCDWYGLLVCIMRLLLSECVLISRALVC